MNMASGQRIYTFQKNGPKADISITKEMRRGQVSSRFFHYLCVRKNNQMDKLVEQKIRESLGSGTLYEVHPYRTEGYEIIPKKKDFTELSSWNQYCSLACVEKITDNTESKVISDLRTIFGSDAKFLYFSESPTLKECVVENESVLFQVEDKKVFTDMTGYFIVCQPKKKELDFSSFPGVEFDSWHYFIPEA